MSKRARAADAAPARSHRHLPVELRKVNVSTFGKAIGVQEAYKAGLAAGRKGGSGAGAPRSSGSPSKILELLVACQSRLPEDLDTWPCRSRSRLAGGVSLQARDSQIEASEAQFRAQGSGTVERRRSRGSRGVAWGPRRWRVAGSWGESTSKVCSHGARHRAHLVELTGHPAPGSRAASRAPASA